MTRRRKQVPRRRPYRPSRNRVQRPAEVWWNPAGIRVDRLTLREAAVADLVLGPALGLFLLACLLYGGDDLITRLAYTTRAETAEATVTAVVRGRPEVVFTTADGTEVTTIARGSHDPAGPSEVTVRHLPGDPESAVLDNGLWVPPIVYGAPPVLILLVLLLRHPRGPHEALYRARLHAYRRKEPTRQVFTLPVTLRLSVGAALSAVAVALLASGLGWAAVDRLAGRAAELPAIAASVFGAVLVLPGLHLLFQGWCRYLERAPQGKPPVPPSLFSDRAYLALLCSPVVALLLVTVFAGLVEARPVTTPVQGTARVLAVGCGDVIGKARGCNDAVAFGYEVNGVPYRSVLKTRGWAYHEGREVPVVWDAADPSNVRLDEAEATSGRYPGFTVGTAE